MSSSAKMHQRKAQTPLSLSQSFKPPHVVSPRVLSTSSSGLSRSRSQFKSLVSLLLCTVFVIVTLSVFHGFRSESVLAVSPATRNFLATRHFDVQSRHTFRQASSILDLDDLTTTHPEALQGVTSSPCSTHASSVFPRPNDEPIDSTVVVTFDVFRRAPHTGEDPVEAELEAIVRSVVASDTFNDTEKRQVVRNAALWAVGRALLSRPFGSHTHSSSSSPASTSSASSGGHPHSSEPASQYFTFFSGRNASSWTLTTKKTTSGVRPRIEGDTQQPVVCDDVATPVVQERYPPGAPVMIDVVYTHVTDDSRSQRAFRKAFPQAFRGSVHRFRDWDELKFSTRAVFHRAVCSDPMSLCFGEDKAAGEKGAPLVQHPMELIRNIIIIVADSDQVPHYLNTSHPRIRIVDHKMLFGSEENTIPSFNSFAIESAMHRIPGLSRFFVYFNNDMMWGRQVSLFDYFRPLAEPRFAARLSLLDAQLAAHSVLCAGNTSDGVLEEILWSSSGIVDVKALRVTMMFEPIMHHENVEKSSDVKFERKNVSTTTTTPPAASLPRNCARGNNNSSVDRSERYLSFSDFQPLFLLANGRRASVLGERFRTQVSNNKNYAMEVMGIGGWQSHSYSHSPHLWDRDIVTEMMEKDFKRAARATRRSQLRKESNLWMTMLANSYHLMHRKVLDWELLEGSRIAALRRLAAVGSNRTTAAQRGGGEHGLSRGLAIDEQEAAPDATYLHPPLIRWGERNQSVAMMDVLAPYWREGLANGPFRDETHRYSHGMWRAMEYLLTVVASAKNIAVHHFNPELVEQKLGRFAQSSASDAQHNLCMMLTGHDASAARVLLPLLLAPSTTLLRGQNVSLAAGADGVPARRPSPHEPELTFYAIAEDCARALHKNTKKNHKAATAATEWSIAELEKFDHEVMSLDQRAGMYHFCMMNSIRAVKRYTDELTQETKLFVTVNDDLRVHVSKEVKATVSSLLNIASGHLPHAAWEVWWRHQSD